MFANPTIPNLTDFTTFVWNQGVLPSALPADSVYLEWSLGYAQNLTLIPPSLMVPIVYVMAVYNLGMHHLLKTAQDQIGQNFFQTQRATYGLLTFTSGPVESAEDQGSNADLLIPDWMKNMTLSALDCMKTPWGREYIDYTQQFGPNECGVS